MRVKKKIANGLIKFLIGNLLLIGFVLSNASGVWAQKKPPLLQTKDNEVSAYTIEDVKKLEKGYEDNWVKPSAEGQEAARQYRNRLIAVGIEQTDAYFYGYLKRDRQKRVWLQFLLDFLEIGAATAINITNGERAKDLIAEGLGALQASRTSLNKNFKLLERQILINQMMADRGEILLLILEKLDRGVGAYPWEAARSDLRNYLNAGTLDSALSRLSATTGKAANDAEKNVRQFKGLRIVSPLTPDQRQASQNAEDNKSKLRAAVLDDSKKAAALTALKKVVGALEDNEEIRDLMKTKGISPAPDDPKLIMDSLIEIAIEQRKKDRNDIVKAIDKAIADFGKMQ